jgi:hypothetical protein
MEQGTYTVMRTYDDGTIVADKVAKKGSEDL